MKRRLAIALLAALSASAFAQQYPVRPIRMIVPFAAGGPGDFLARTVSPKLTEALGQSIVVDNRGGANGQIATETTAKADPDGHTVLIISAGHTVNATLYPKLPYDSVRDFTPIMRMVSGPAIVVVHPSVPANSVKEFIAYVRQRPGKVNFASSGTGAPSHLAVELFKVMTKTDLVHVPYKGIAPGIVDLLSGQVQVAFPTMVAGLVHARAGRLRAMAVTSTQRSPAAPDLPTMAEAGIPGYEATNWYGLVGPAKMQPAVVTRLNSELTRILAIPDIRDRLSAQGMDTSSLTPTAFGAYMRAEIGKWARVIEAAHVKAD
ncbi:MAG: tripartite tricarboxylate transporter substrate binding protein [Rhodospirillaceae bacterium]